MHVSGKHHKEAASAASSSRSVTSFYKPQLRQSVTEAEVRWAMYTAKHNLSFLSSDHASKLFKVMFSDSEIAKSFSSGHTKTAAVITDGLAPHFHAKTVSNLYTPFSILIDESNDKVDKSCIILVKLLEPELGNVCTRFLDMPVVNIGTAVNIFRALKESLEKNGLSFSKAVSFMSDTANVMKGCRSGVQMLIKNEISHLYDVGCTCHLADLTIKAGVTSLPVDIDQLFIDIFYYFYYSSKRNQEFADFWHSLFTTEPQAILKHCPTRWLSLLRCVNRYLNQYEGLKSYFVSCDEQSGKVISITQRLENPHTKPILNFLAHVLPSMDRFSRTFQKSTENTTCEVCDEMCRLVRLYASNILKKEAILEVGDYLKKLKLDASSQVTDEHLGIGDDTWVSVADLEQKYDTKPFFSAVRKIYLETIQKMLKKFPFGDTLMKNLSILDPNKVCSFSSATVVGLAKRFPQLGLDDPESLRCLEEEFTDFTLSPMDLLTPQQYNAVGHIKRVSAGPFWWKVGKIKTLSGELRFSKLFMLMSGLLSIPCSNADAERGFSVLRKVHTDQRASLSQSTIINLLRVKMNNTDCCFDTTVSDELITKCKKATTTLQNKSK